MIKVHCRPWEYCVILSRDKHLAVVAPQEPRCDYVRIIYDGHEIAYWTVEDWKEDLEGSVGMLMGVIALINLDKAGEVTAWLRGDMTLKDLFDEDTED